MARKTVPCADSAPENTSVIPNRDLSDVERDLGWTVGLLKGIRVGLGELSRMHGPLDTDHEREEEYRRSWFAAVLEEAIDCQVDALEGVAERLSKLRGVRASEAA